MFFGHLHHVNHQQGCMQGGFVMGGSVIQLIGAVLRTPFHAAGCLLTLFAAAQILLELSDRKVRSRL